MQEAYYLLGALVGAFCDLANHGAQKLLIMINMQLIVQI